MSIEQTDKVDFLSIEKQTNMVKLTISDHLGWNKENEHLLLLQEKINTYLRFIESGELFDVYPEAKGKKILIYIASKYEPSKLCKVFFEKASSVIAEAGFILKFETVVD